MTTLPTVQCDPDQIISKAYDLYARDLLRHCCFRRFSREDAEEIVQETFINVWQYLEGGNQVENLKAFLFRVVNNLIVDKVRRSKQEKKISLDALQEQGFDIENGDEEAALQNRCEAKNLLQTLKEEVGQEEHDLLRLRFVHGLMPADIASRTGVSSNTISVRLHRALKKVIAYLK